MTKNWLPAELGAMVRAMDSTPVVVDQVVLAEAVGGELAVDLIAGAAHAVAVGAAALDHEAGDDPVEGQAVIEALVSQRDEVVDGVGSLLGIQLAAHNAAVLHGDGYDGIAHISFVPF